MCKYKPLGANIHGHADAGSLDGGSTAMGKLKYVQSTGRTSDCLTDHGMMSGLSEHWYAAKKLKMKSIHGIEAYMVDEHRPGKKLKDGTEIPKYYHLTIHFKTQEAYFYFCRLTKDMEDRALVKFGERKPLMYFRELEPIAHQITIASGCLIGPIQKNLLLGRPDIAEQMYNYLRNMVGPENFYVEVFPHKVDHNWKRAQYAKNSKIQTSEGRFEPITTVDNWEGRPEDQPQADPCTGTLDIQRSPNLGVIELAKKYKDRIVISLDDHFGHPDDYIVQSARLGNGEEQWKFYNSYHALTSEEAAENLIKYLGVSEYEIENWIDNSYHFVDQFNNYSFPDRTTQVLLPKVSMIYSESYIKDKTNMDIFWDKVALHNRMPSKDNPQYQTYMDRVTSELEVLGNNDAGIDFLPYLFILEDMCNYARLKKFSFTSRGSAGSSLALYLIGIVVTDPIKYNLSFERFLNPGRIKEGSWPDVDLDWEDRDLIIDYVFNKYGNHAAKISTDFKMKLKSSIKDAERAIYGSVSKETDDLTRSIKVPLTVKDEFKWLFKGVSDDSGSVTEEPYFDNTKDPIAIKLREYAEAHPKVWDMVKRCLGITRQKGIHAGGVIITPGPVHNFMPIMKTRKGEEYATSYNMLDVELAGGVKYDLLGVTTLKAVGVALRSIKDVEGVDIDVSKIPEDIEVYENTIKMNKLEGIFQLNTDTAKPLVRDIQPKNILEISALTSLGRPGALDAPAPDPSYNGGAAKYYIECAQGRRRPFYFHPELEPVLSETYGVILYQEQSIKIGVICAGYSEGEADIIIRKGIGKKDPIKIKKFTDDLMARLPARGWTEQQITLLIESVKATANYQFNKSHAISYAIVAWTCAYLKHYYPAHYWKGMLTAFLDDQDKITGFLAECSDRILPVDIVKSQSMDWAIEGNKLRTPPGIIKGCGDKGLEALYKFFDRHKK